MENASRFAISNLVNGSRNSTSLLSCSINLIHRAKIYYQINLICIYSSYDHDASVHFTLTVKNIRPRQA